MATRQSIRKRFESRNLAIILHRSLRIERNGHMWKVDAQGTSTGRQQARKIYGCRAREESLCRTADSPSSNGDSTFFFGKKQAHHHGRQVVKADIRILPTSQRTRHKFVSPRGASEHDMAVLILDHGSTDHHVTMPRAFQIIGDRIDRWSLPRFKAPVQAQHAATLNYPRRRGLS